LTEFLRPEKLRMAGTLFARAIETTGPGLKEPDHVQLVLVRLYYGAFR